ncbi:MAG TPA: hypothetical protein PLK12_04945 [Prolixibacteraceae bacterium]|nr:hypothetical protein [Prolixibacteraceae bacterium]
MKNLNFPGVRELDANEMKKENGGNPFLVAIGIMLLAEIVLNPQTHTSAFMEGWNMAKN